MGYVYKGTQPEPAPLRDASTPGPKPAFDPAKCGTRKGYRQHLRHGQDACAPCTAANTASSSAYRAARRVA